MSGRRSREREQEQAVREAAYFIWERAGRPEGCALQHWQQATRESLTAETDRAAEPFEDEEKILAGRPDANMPALLTKDVHGG